MTPEVIWSTPALRDMGSIDRSNADRISRAIDRMAFQGHGDVMRITGRRREWRLRVGRWRVILTREQDDTSILILRVLPRSTAYRR